LLQAERALKCAHDSKAALGLLQSGKSHGRAYTRAYQRLYALALLTTGDANAALGPLMEMASRGDSGVYALLSSPSLQALAPTRIRPVYDALAKALRDQLPPSIRAELARLCAATGDVECARFHAFRAASRGQKQVTPVLEWIGRIHRSSRVRRAAGRWQSVLSLEADRSE
jgi:hypothetical protein